MFRTEKLPGFDAQCVLVKGISLESMPGPTASTVLYVQPCATVEGRVNCELRFGIPGKGALDIFYDFPTLSCILDAYDDDFDETRVSSNLGIARVQWRGKKILISKNGRIIIREAIDEEDARETIDFLSRLLAPSIICDRCGQVVFNCALGGCGECARQQASLKALPVNILWTEGFQRMQNLAKALTERRDSLEKEAMGGPAVSYEPLSTQVDGMAHLSLDIIVHSSNREELAVGVLLLRQAWDLSLILGLFEQLRQHNLPSDRNSIISILQMLKIWLLALEESVDGILDEEARQSSKRQWAQFSEAWSSFRRQAENNSTFEAILSPLVERWPD